MTSQPTQTFYVAFLRGINVGGHKQVAMSDLTVAFSRLGFADVSTWIQSGNVLFAAPHSDAARVGKKIEKEMAKRFGFEIVVFLRTSQDLQSLIAARPFQGRRLNKNTKSYVTFTKSPMAAAEKLPLWSPKRDVELFKIAGCDAFSLAHRRGTQFGFPNAFIEKQFGIPATTRNWNTIERVAQLLP